MVGASLPQRSTTMAMSGQMPHPSKRPALSGPLGGVLAVLLLVLLSVSITPSGQSGSVLTATPGVSSSSVPLAPSDIPHCHHGHHQERPALALLRSTLMDIEPAALAPPARPIAAAPGVTLSPRFLPGRIMAPAPPLYLLTQRFRS